MILLNPKIRHYSDINTVVHNGSIRTWTRLYASHLLRGSRRDLMKTTTTPAICGSWGEAVA